MLDVTNNTLTNSLKGNIDEVLNTGKVIASISINRKQYPSKIHSRSPWILLMEGREIKIYDNRDKKICKKILMLDLAEINLGVAKGFNNAPGIFMTQSLCFEMNVRIENKEYCFICEDLKPIPEVIKWLKENDMLYRDYYNLEQLYSENNSEEVVEILYNKIKEIQYK